MQAQGKSHPLRAALPGGPEWAFSCVQLHGPAPQPVSTHTCSQKATATGSCSIKASVILSYRQLPIRLPTFSLMALTYVAVLLQLAMRASVPARGPGPEASEDINRVLSMEASVPAQHLVPQLCFQHLGQAARVTASHANESADL